MQKQDPDPVFFDSPGSKSGFYKDDKGGEWIQGNSRYSGCTQLKISEFSADPCKNSDVNNE